MADVYDKGSGKKDWETHSLRYVIYALTSAQKRQQKLWNQVSKTRTAAGLIPINWPLIEEYIESVRRTYSMMIDLETVGKEYETKFGRRGRSGRKAKAKSAKPARKKARKKK